MEAKGYEVRVPLLKGEVTSLQNCAHYLDVKGECK